MLSNYITDELKIKCIYHQALRFEGQLFVTKSLT